MRSTSPNIDRFLEWTFHLSHNVMYHPTRTLDLHSLPARSTPQKHTRLKVPSTIYNPILMTKEFNNETHDQHNMICGKGTFIALIE